VGPEPLDGVDEAVGVARANRNVRQPEPVEGGERRAGDERPGVVGRDDPLARRDARRGVAARRAGDPVVEIAGGERDVARRPRRPAGRVDPDDLGELDAQVRAEWIVRRDRRSELVLRGQRELPDVLEATALEAG
jgi:hypothetical protein